MREFEEVTLEILEKINDIHYEDKNKEIIKLQVMYILCKMTQSEKEFEDNIKILDKNRR